MKRASVFLLEDKYLINGQSTTESGFAVASDPFIRMDKTAAIEDVANNMMLAMNQSKTGVIESADALKNFLNIAGLKNHKDLYKSSVHCMVYEKDLKLIFLPSVNAGIKGGFKYAPKQKIEIDANAPIDVIAAALEKTLALCK